MHFTDGTGIVAYDDGRSCCEARYMTTDDDLSGFIGATFIGMDLREGPTADDEFGQPHETQFLLVNTSLGPFTLVTHNEHNGEYGGFYIQIRELADE